MNNNASFMFTGESTLTDNMNEEPICLDSNEECSGNGYFFDNMLTFDTTDMIQFDQSMSRTSVGATGAAEISHCYRVENNRLHGGFVRAAAFENFCSYNGVGHGGADDMSSLLLTSAAAPNGQCQFSAPNLPTNVGIAIDSATATAMAATGSNHDSRIMQKNIIYNNSNNNNSNNIIHSNTSSKITNHTNNNVKYISNSREDSQYLSPTYVYYANGTGGAGLGHGMGSGSSECYAASNASTYLGAENAFPALCDNVNGVASGLYSDATNNIPRNQLAKTGMSIRTEDLSMAGTDSAVTQVIQDIFSSPTQQSLVTQYPLIPGMIDEGLLMSLPPLPTPCRETFIAASSICAGNSLALDDERVTVAGPTSAAAKVFAAANKKTDNKARKPRAPRATKPKKAGGAAGLIGAVAKPVSPARGAVATPTAAVATAVLDVGPIASELTDEQLLKLLPKKVRKKAKFDSPVASRFCHVCSRTPKNVRLAVCANIHAGVCRKVVCERCFDDYKYGSFAEAHGPGSAWICPHCSDGCPERAQCRTYSRINDRLRATRLKQPKNSR
jgi:hypothetical protein